MNDKFYAPPPMTEQDIQRAKELGKNASPASKWATIEALLNPVECYVCPHCGQNAERPGKPLISREDALKLLGFDDDLNRQKDTAFIPDQ